MKEKKRLAAGLLPSENPQEASLLTLTKSPLVGAVRLQRDARRAAGRSLPRQAASDGRGPERQLPVAAGVPAGEPWKGGGNTTWTREEHDAKTHKKSKIKNCKKTP